jgi:hypothetical protein
VSDDEERIELEIPAVTAPTFPWEVVLHNSATFYQRMVGGGMQLKFCPLLPTPQGHLPVPPGVTIEFNAEAWERFKREVAVDGEKPRVETFRSFGGGPLNGGGE